MEKKTTPVGTEKAPWPVSNMPEHKETLASGHTSKQVSLARSWKLLGTLLDESGPTADPTVVLTSKNSRVSAE